jgi:hypothetical protein
MLKAATMDKVLARSPGIILIAVCLWVAFGAAWTGSGTAVAGVALFVMTGLAVYTLLLAQRRLGRTLGSLLSYLTLPVAWRQYGLWIIGGFAIAVAIVHLTAFNGFTIPETLRSNDAIEIALIRQGVTTSIPGWMRYTSSIAIRSLFPIVLVLAVANRQIALAVLTGSVGLLYAVSLMQKSGPVLLLLPLVCYLALKSRLLGFSFGAALIAGTVLSMGFLANPTLRPNAHIVTEGTDPHPPASINSNPSDGRKTEQLASGLFHRVAVVPGEVVGQWFAEIPASVPYGYGCGYRFLAPLLGCGFQDYTRILYDKEYPQEASMGLQGTLNAASMMNAYANFGWWGLVASGVIHAILLWGLTIIFCRDLKMILPINVTFLVLLSSGDFFTTLLSGGWAAAIVLFVLLGRQENRSSKTTPGSQP